MKLLIGRWQQTIAAAILFLGAATYAEDGLTRIHEAGRCAIRGHCGKQGFFGKDLPCPDNGLAREPTSETRKKLVDVCGDKWAEGPVCCADDQARSQTPYVLELR